MKTPAELWVDKYCPVRTNKKKRELWIKAYEDLIKFVIDNNIDPEELDQINAIIECGGKLPDGPILAAGDLDYTKHKHTFDQNKADKCNADYKLAVGIKKWKETGNQLMKDVLNSGNEELLFRLTTAIRTAGSDYE